ncbi:bifunctional diguanylate cyclase/phosphodiesterase [Mycolicibacterium tusciae]|jgi:diguanylate cyclase (GGDEF)-like protein/PAS domain S-box-containing protein|uniref:Diguanylate cyclase n=1 Tax=Mycolicibacterium tusciae TaxID=75922 RepID=A0A1X0JQL1_9MYCO|nr:sensor domain-containing diguanylate cyclase [Mycolicibacterium tusciae]ORB65193.1 diguanylate cyclase [Mycolicibacterium tusciae]
MTAGDDDAGTTDASSLPLDPVEERFRRLLEHSPDPMCVHAEGRVVYVNPAGLRGIAAKSADDLVGRMITDFVHPDSIAPMLGRIASLHREGDSTPAAEAVMLRLDGSPVDAEVVSVLTSWDGKPAYQVIFRDLTIEKAAEATLRYQAALVTHATDAIIATTLAGAITTWNPAAEAIYGRSAADALDLPINEAVGAAVDPAAIVADGGVQHSIHYSADGTALIVRVAAAAMDDGYVLVCSDQTALRRAERRFQTVVDSLVEGVVVLDADGQPEWINPAARRILGLPFSGKLPHYADLSEAFPLYDAEGHELEDWHPFFVRSLTTGVVPRHVVVGFDRPDGARRWLSVSSRLLDPAETGQQALLASFTDVTDQRDAQLQLKHQAHHDSLTGLPNRAYAEAQATQALQADPPTLAAVMFIDLDNIKTVNDAFGHYAGDAVIKTAAQRLRATLRSEDLIARHGGDEFVALLFGNPDYSALERLAERLHAALAAPLDVAGIACSLTASIGVTQVAPEDSRDAAEILRDADAAMYKAKVYRATTHFMSP